MDYEHESPNLSKIQKFSPSEERKANNFEVKTKFISFFNLFL
jgi:hypothetical protein